MGPDRARVDGQEVRFRLPLFEPGGAPGQHVSQEGGGSRVKPPMPGRIVSVRVREGQRVAKGEVLLVLEAMKMQNEVVAPRAGVVAKLHVREGQVVDGATPLADLEG
jgi:biotin carboxyl carrier protein